MADPKSTQDRFTHDRWQAGRLTYPGLGGDESDTWVIDVVVVEANEDEDIRAIGRYRPLRGMTPDLGPVLDRAIREPVDGRPHLPAVVRVATAELAAEIRKVRPELKITIGPTPLVDDLGGEAAEQILPDPEHGEEQWQWLANGVDAAQIGRLFAALDAAVPHILGGALTTGQLMRMRVPTLGLAPAWLHVTAEGAITGGSVMAIAIAPNAETREAWNLDESTKDEVAIYGIERDELAPGAFAEIEAHGWIAKAGYFPRVTVAADEENYPNAQQVEIAIAALESIAQYQDVAGVKLSSGAAATIEIAPDEFLEFPGDPDQLEDIEGYDDEPDDDDDEDDQFLFLDAQRTWAAAPEPQPATVVRVGPKIGRNDPCHCGSGVKFKKCHGA